MIVAAALAAALSFRVVPLACTPNGLAISGGGIIRLAPESTCSGITPGRAISITLDEQNRAVLEKLDPASHPASELPKTAFAIAPAATAAPEGNEITMTIVVTIPPSTPAGSDIYLSTERSSFNPSEIRMDQLDARRYKLEVRLQEGGRLAFRVTRGSFQTIERDAKGRLPPPHIITGRTGTTYPVTVAAWSDDI
jgi:hypothetical protein